MTSPARLSSPSSPDARTSSNSF
ncbi:hypothetical protein R3I94_008661 [Phoxinus phoxinus]